MLWSNLDCLGWNPGCTDVRKCLTIDTSGLCLMKLNLCHCSYQEPSLRCMVETDIHSATLAVNITWTMVETIANLGHALHTAAFCLLSSPSISTDILGRALSMHKEANMERGERVSGLWIMLSSMCSFAVLSNAYVLREADFLILKRACAAG